MKKNWLANIFKHSDLLKMGHDQSKKDLNIGLGWLYYAQVRISKPKRIICIGSWRGFVPIVLAQALMDNGNKGKLIFIDPSLADNFWSNKKNTYAWFKKFGLTNIEHHLMTTQEFVTTKLYKKLANIGVVFIDGFHSADQAEFDFNAFKNKLSSNGSVFFHDSVRKFTSAIYGKNNKYTHDVYKFIKKIKKLKQYQCIDFYEGSGVTLLKKNIDTTTLSKKTY
jgi:predicted O-methyltransferase YrrM